MNNFVVTEDEQSPDRLATFGLLCDHAIQDLDRLRYERAREGVVPLAQRRICALCGRAFAIGVPPGEPETNRDRLCPECLALPAPPQGTAAPPA